MVMMMMRRSSLAVLLATAFVLVASLPKTVVSSSDVSYSYSGPGSPPQWNVSPGGAASFSYSGTGPIPPEIARFLPPGISFNFGPNQPSQPQPSRRVDPGNRRSCENAAHSDTWWQCVAARNPHEQCCSFWRSVKRNCLDGLQDSDADQIEPRLARHCCDNN